MNESEFISDYQYEIPEVPKECQDCGVQCGLSTEIIGLTYMKDQAIQEGLDLLGEESDEFHALADEHLSPELAERMKQDTRNSVNETLECIDENIERLKIEKEAKALACSGLLKMRASKTGTTYTVGVCTSSLVYNGNQFAHIPAHVETHPEQ